MMELHHKKIQYWFTWISLAVFHMAGFGLMLFSWNGVVRGQAFPWAMILLWAAMSASGIYLFMLAVKKAHRRMINEERSKEQEAKEARDGIPKGHMPKRDQDTLDPATASRKLLRRIPDDITLDELGKELMPLLARELEIMSGVYYVRKKDSFHPVATYALASSGEPYVFKLGEGLSGQVASKGTIRVLSQLPEGHKQV